MCLLAEWSPIAMQLQTFIASALLLSGLASAVNLPRANEAAECAPSGEHCSRRYRPHCCTGRCSGEISGVSGAIYTVFVLLLTQLWCVALPPLVIDWLLAPVRKLSSMNQGQIKFPPVIAHSYFLPDLAFTCVCLMNHYE